MHAAKALAIDLGLSVLGDPGHQRRGYTRRRRAEALPIALAERNVRGGQRIEARDATLRRGGAIDCRQNLHSRRHGMEWRAGGQPECLAWLHRAKVAASAAQELA